MQNPSDNFTSHLNVCYEVLLYLAYRMQQLAPGEVLEFTSSDPQAPEALLPWIEARGDELLSMDYMEDGLLRFWIRRSA